MSALAGTGLVKNAITRGEREGSTTTRSRGEPRLGVGYNVITRLVTSPVRERSEEGLQCEVATVSRAPCHLHRALFGALLYSIQCPETL